MADISQITEPTRIIIWTPTENCIGFVSLEHVDKGTKRFMSVGEASHWNSYPDLDTYILNAIANSLQKLFADNGISVPIFHSKDEGAK